MVRLASVVAVLALAAPAQAEVLKLFGEVHGGGEYGVGTGGDQKSSAFFQKTRGPTYGVLVGAEFLFLDAWLQHHQYVNGNGVQTWTQLGVGLHFTSNLGSAEDKKVGKGGYIEVGAGLWFGVGTGAQVMPPLDNAQLTDKGFLAEGRFGFGKHLDSIFDLGVVVPVHYGYFFKSGNGAAVNDLSTHYQGMGAEALLVLRGNIRL